MQKKTNKKKILSPILIFVGLALIAVALGIEAYRYPWGTLFGTATDGPSMPEPTPIVLDSEDDGSIIADVADVQTANPSGYGLDASEVLPGSETANASSSVYVQLGIIKIPKLNVSQFVLEGTQRQMRYGAGHVTGTNGIGEAGICAIAGHRPAAFRYLDKLSAGDSIILKANDNVYTYTVYDSFDVLPDETWVLSDIEGEDYALTLITCTPYLVSSHRLIVRARLTDINGTAPSDYFQNSTPAID